MVQESQHKALQPSSGAGDDSRVVPDQLDMSPFLQAEVVPADVITPRPYAKQQLWEQPWEQPQKQQQRQQRRSKAPSALARLFCCTAPSALEGPEQQHLPDVKPAASPMQSLRSQHSWGKVFADKHHQHLHTAPSSEYYDARSNASDLTPQHSLEHAGSVGAPEQAHRGLEQQHSAGYERPHWVPPQPLLFAPPGLKFVPVPEETGFAGVWELIKERTTPHPQPIDVMSGANAIVRKVHASVPGITIEEDPKTIKMIAQPGFMPRGLPAAHVEVYDKTHATAPSWMPRRDCKLGTGHGHVYFTEDRRMIIRHETWSILGRKPDFIVEDYCHLEEGGQVLVDRMCACNFRTGQRAEQLQVVRLVQKK